MIKNALVLLIALTLTFSLIHCSNKETKTDEKSTELEWFVTLEEALQAAQEEDKSIFVNFTGSDWCGWCFKLNDEVFAQSEFIQYAQDELILLKLDFPRNLPQTEATKNYNQALLQKFKVRGFPTIILLDKFGNEINRTGYQAGGAAKYVEHLQKMID
ncbi:MAG: hypothetical protein APR54_09600 [Candidatus Cloacimonas sp. SDB]|nr:MAG: hypothetical protein APR54_09600 [Candidatus Cloacimonas sp. SDB]